MKVNKLIAINLPSSLFVAVKPFVNPFSKTNKSKTKNKTIIANNTYVKA